MSEITTIKFKLRPHQRLVNTAFLRFNAIVMHRRAGKSVFAVAKLMSEATANDRPGRQYHYVGPSIKQTKAIAWQYVIKFAGAVPGCILNIAELKCTLPGGATIELCGVENVDALRGRYSHGIVLDEAQLFPLSHWTYVIRPLLADHMGWAMICGTPAGKRNLLGWSIDQEDWNVQILPVSDTDALPAAEIADMRKGMSVEAAAQELDCSFTAALQGAIYARAIDELQQSNRLTMVRYDENLPVTAAIDLGWRDHMPVIFHQMAGTEHRIIWHRSYQFTSIPQMLHNWKSLPFPIDKIILPHDAKVHELGSGKTRQERFEEHGHTTTLAPNQSLNEGIEAVRIALPHVWIDRDEAYDVFEALSSYRSELVELRGVYKTAPIHDTFSHIADAMRYLIIGDHSSHISAGFGPRGKASFGVYT